MAFRLVGNRLDAEDLTQEAYFRAYRSFDNYEGDKPFENWIFRIVTRLFLDLLRSRRRRVQTIRLPEIEVDDDTIYFDVADSTPTADQRMASGTMSEELQAVLDSLTQEQRTLVMLADVEGLPYKEISELLGKPSENLRSRLHRTHKLMRKRLEANLYAVHEPTDSEMYVGGFPQ